MAAPPSEARAGVVIRRAGPSDAAGIWRIYNEGIEDGLATFASGRAMLAEVEAWFGEQRFAALVAELYRQAVGWTSLGPYRDGPAFDGIAELAVYVDRTWRRHAVGHLLVEAALAEARARGLYKVLGYLLEQNLSSLKLVEKLGFRVVGLHHRHGPARERAANVVVVEKLL